MFSCSKYDFRPFAALPLREIDTDGMNWPKSRSRNHQLIGTLSMRVCGNFKPGSLPFSVDRLCHVGFFESTQAAFCFNCLHSMVRILG